MSDQELEIQNEADEILEREEEVISSKAEELDEKASVKKEDDDEVPVDTDDGEEEDDDEDEKEESKKSAKEATVPKTKTAMINAVLSAMKGLKKDDIASNWGKINAAMNPFEKDDEKDDEDKDKEKEESKKSVKEVKKVTKEDIDVSADVKAIFGDEDLTEEFKTSATTIFEAAVVSKINEVLETACIDLDAEVEAEKEEIMETLSTRLDDYLEYVVEEWTKENELAVQQGIRLEITENFMSGLRSLFSENYIDIPEEKTDLVDELADKVQELETSVNAEMEKNITLSKDLNEMKKEKILKNVSEGLSETQTEKLRSLSDGIEFEDDENYKEKLETVKENYFPSEEVSDSSTDEEPLAIEDNKEADGSMSAYMSAISRSIKK